MPQIVLQGRAINYSLRESKRARRVFVSAKRDMSLEVVFPWRHERVDPERILRQKTDWILRTLDKFENERQANPARVYENGEIFKLRGKAYPLRVKHWKDRRQMAVTIVRELLELRCHRDTPVDCKRMAIEGWYRQHAKAYLPQRTEELARKHGFSYGKLRIKTRRRAGAAARTRAISTSICDSCKPRRKLLTPS